MAARGERRLAAAAVVGLIAALAAAAPMRAAPGRAAPAPEPDPTISTQPSDPPAPPPEVAITADDIAVGAGYWQGTAETYRLTVRVRNSGTPAITARTQITLPPGVTRVTTTAAGCTVEGLSVECPIVPRSSVTIAVDVTVAPGLWRDPPAGSARVTATSNTGPDGRPAVDEATFGVDFPPGPPTPGIDLSISDPFLPAEPADPAAATETAALEVRLANTGAVQAEGTVDVVTPAGVEVGTVPSECVTRVRVSAERERCELGRVPAGQRVTLRFVLVVDLAARAEVPLLGNVHAELTPAGQDPAAVQSSYSVLVVDRPIDQDVPAADSDPAVTVAQPRRGAGLGGAETGVDASRIGQPLSVLPMLISIIGVFSVVTAMVILSLRRRASPVAGPAGE